MSQRSSTNEFKAYSFSDIKVYSSTEWFANNRKQYRQVFEESTIKYIYVDLTLINKLYERDNWDLKVELKCFNLSKGKNQVCVLNINKSINLKDHFIHIREGWGHKKRGNFWKKGKYVWEVHIDGTKVASKYFYVEDLSNAKLKAYELALKVDQIAFYESGVENIESTSLRRYHTGFDIKSTRYVFVEVLIQNRFIDSDWHGEVIMKFFSESKELKGEIVRLEHIKKGQNLIEINGGWGSNVVGSWRTGAYSVDIVFQNKVIGSSSFTIGKVNIEGIKPVRFSDSLINLESSLINTLSKGNDAFKQLHELVGLRNIKNQIQEHSSYLKFITLRKERGLKEDKLLTLHSVFSGNPGTGKTTVARLLGSIYKELGLLNKGHVHEVSRVDLIGEYIGQTAPKVKEAIDLARGGVLFIDEAYSLARNQDDNKDFGREAIELIIKEMSHPDCNFMVIAAGYPDQMKTFINSNPGLNSRFKYQFDFLDYRYEELLDIKAKMCSAKDLVLTDKADQAINDIIKRKYRNRNSNFGNGRFVESILEKAKVQMGIRVVKIKTEVTDSQLMEIRYGDILRIDDVLPKNTTWNIEIDNELLQEGLEELNELTGLTDLKIRINEVVDIVKYQKESNVEDLLSTFGLHSVFVGNPGTGKTTVARIFGKIYKALGLLEKGHVVETDRQGLVAGYIGQTETKTMSVIKEAAGGVLFIDEAYSLSKSTSQDFGYEAVQVLIKQMEDKRHHFAVIVAGYPKEMSRFLEINPGLKSRFNNTFVFDDFKIEELVLIAQEFFKVYGYTISSKAISHLRIIIEGFLITKNKSFGNARVIRNLVEEIIHQQNIRVARSDNNLNATLRLIKATDVEMSNFSLKEDFSFKRKTVGF